MTAERMTGPTLVDVMNDPALFGPLFAAPSWRAWKAFCSAVFGLTVSAEAADLIRRCTGRRQPPAAPVREVWAVCGRRAGKSRIAALLAVFIATFRDYRRFLAAGEVGTVMLLAADRKQARVLFRYVAGFLDAVPLLRKSVTKRTKEAIEIIGVGGTRLVIEIQTSSFRSVRGYTIVAAIADEIAFWPTDDSANPDTEVLNALRPAMATVPDSMLVCITTGYARRGEPWKAKLRLWGKDDPSGLFWNAPSLVMNETLDRGIIEAAFAADPEVAAAEWAGEFRRDIEGLFNRNALTECVVTGRRELPPQSGLTYRAFLDFAGGSGSDSATLAIAHSEQREGVQVEVLDALRERRPPFSPEVVCGEFAALIKTYRASRATSDKYAGNFPIERMRAHGIQVDPAAKPKSEIYRELLPIVNSGRCELLDEPRLLAQLAALERRTARGGRDTVDHPPQSHDDVANAAAGVIGGTVPAAEPNLRVLGSDVDDDFEPRQKYQWPSDSWRGRT